MRKILIVALLVALYFAAPCEAKDKNKKSQSKDKKPKKNDDNDGGHWKVVEEGQAILYNQPVGSIAHAGGSAAAPLDYKAPGDKMVDTLADLEEEEEEYDPEEDFRTVEELKSAVAKATERRENLIRQANIMEAKVALSNLRDESRGTIEHLTTTKHLIEDLEREIAYTKEDKEQLEAKLQAEIQEHESDIAEKSKQLEEAKNYLESFKQELMTIDSEMSQLKAELQKLVNGEINHIDIDAIVPSAHDTPAEDVSPVIDVIGTPEESSEPAADSVVVESALEPTIVEDTTSQSDVVSDVITNTMDAVNEAFVSSSEPAASTESTGFQEKSSSLRGTQTVN